jgi:hypothetical protein
MNAIKIGYPNNYDQNCQGRKKNSTSNPIELVPNIELNCENSVDAEEEDTNGNSGILA